MFKAWQLFVSDYLDDAPEMHAVFGAEIQFGASDYYISSLKVTHCDLCEFVGDVFILVLNFFEHLIE